MAVPRRSPSLSSAQALRRSSRLNPGQASPIPIAVNDEPEVSVDSTQIQKPYRKPKFILRVRPREFEDVEASDKINGAEPAGKRSPRVSATLLSTHADDGTKRLILRVKLGDTKIPSTLDDNDQAPHSDEEDEVYDAEIHGEPEDQEYYDDLGDRPEEDEELRVLQALINDSADESVADSYSEASSDGSDDDNNYEASPSQTDYQPPVTRKRKRKTLTKAQKSKKNSRRRANKKSKRTRGDGCIQWSIEGEKEIDAMTEEEIDALVETFIRTVEENQRIRMKQASEVPWADVPNSPFTRGFWMHYQASKFTDKIRNKTDWLRSNMARRTMAILGRAITTGKEYLEIDDVSDQELKKSGVYMSMIFDEAGILVGLYIGSRTGKEGVYQRVANYVRVKRTGRRPKSEENSVHLKEALKEGYTWHIRPLLLADFGKVPIATLVGFEGMFTDLCNTMYCETPLPITFGHNVRSQAVIDAYKQAVPVNMLDVPWKPLNHAHQLKQGARSSRMACNTPGCCTKPGGKTTLAGLDGKNFVYLCTESCWKRLFRRLNWFPDWTWDQQLTYLSTHVSSEKGTWHRRSHGAPKASIKCWCASRGPLYLRCEIVAGEKNVSACRNCYANWDHFKKAYLLTKPPEVVRHHWHRFVRHYKIGVGNFLWVEHECQICGIDATRNPPPGYPATNVKFCRRCYDAAKSTKKTWPAWQEFMLAKYGVKKSDEESDGVSDDEKADEGAIEEASEKAIKGHDKKAAAKRAVKEAIDKLDDALDDESVESEDSEEESEVWSGDDEKEDDKEAEEEEDDDYSEMRRDDSEEEA